MAKKGRANILARGGGKGLNTVGSSLTFSALFLLLCYFNITFIFMAQCLFIINNVYYANKLG